MCLKPFTLLMCALAVSGAERQKRLIFPATSLYGVNTDQMKARLKSVRLGNVTTLFVELTNLDVRLAIEDELNLDTFLAIAVPVDIPDKNVFVSYNFEANYNVVTNITQIDEVIFPNLPVVSKRQSRSITRELTYNVLETRFNQFGMSGRACMLRNICEAAETPLSHNGVLGHLMHVVFTPSASADEQLHDDYYKAELAGQGGDCTIYESSCPFSLFDIITKVVHFK